jgi:ribosomal-protein-alanine N-acetyltransferase
MEKGSNLIAALACPPELPEIAWIRLFVVNPIYPLEIAWNILWSASCDELIKLGSRQIAVLSIQSWFSTTLETSGFVHTDNVIVLLHERGQNLPKPDRQKLLIRQMLPEDLRSVEEVDHAAFESEWKNSSDSLEIAYGQSTIATIAEIDGEIVGYQYSTASSMGGHLARLAVRPVRQGHGVGYALLYDLITQFNRHGIEHISVNTQQKNSASLALYKKAGFVSTGESYRVYKFLL